MTMGGAQTADLSLLGLALLEPGDEDEVRLEYNRLLLNPLGAPCPPWQSLHGPEPALFGPPHHSALAWFRQYGYEPRLENEPADHAGVLLIFYARLLEVGADDTVLAAFREQHLAWMVSWAQHLGNESRHPYFRRLATSLCDAVAAS